MEDESRDAPPSDDNDEDVFLEKDKDDKLDSEYHPSFIGITEKRKRRFQEKYQELLRVVGSINLEGRICLTFYYIVPRAGSHN